MKITVIGGGAAGCFCSIEIGRRLPAAEVTVLEAQDRTLAKVAVTGGGRCNLTNSFEDVTDLSRVYPRGHRLMSRALRVFGHRECMEWFEREGVRLVTQEDHCVFPASQDAMQIVNTLRTLMKRHGVQVRTGARVTSVSDDGGRYSITLADGSVLHSDIVVVTTGGRSRGGHDFLAPLGLETVDSVPSLFSVNIEDASLRSLSGIVVEDAVVSLSGSHLSGRGALLITHWGISGPATLRLSSYAARELAAAQYRAGINIRWTGDSSESRVRQELSALAAANPQRLCSAAHPEPLPARLWQHILSRAAIRPDMRWGELGARGLGRLVSTLMSDSYAMTGKSRYKEEFVTCGGVALSAVNPSTMECRTHPGLYLAGEVLDIDAVTGGFNLQAAWSTGYVAACDIFSKLAHSK